MYTVYAAYKNGDMTEGRGPMVINKVFDQLDDANAYIDSQEGVMGRRFKWSEDKYGDWQVRPLVVFNSLDEATEDHRQQLRKNALSKLTADERIALGL